MGATIDYDVYTACRHTNIYTHTEYIFIFNISGLMSSSSMK